MSRKVVIFEDEGRNVARERYGQPTQRIARPSESPTPQDRESRRARFGDTPQSWITGAAPATDKPGFDKGRRR